MAIKDKLNLTWRHGTLILDNSAIGCVQEDSFDRGWWAYGCEDDWQDVKLGQHTTETKARRAVQAWVKEAAA